MSAPALEREAEVHETGAPPAAPERPEFRLAPPPTGWTVDDIDNLPESDLRVELIDGIPYVVPPPSFGHQNALQQLATALNAVKPAGLYVVQGVAMMLADDRQPIPDLVVMRNPDRTKNTFPAEQVVIAVEVVSPSSRSTDRLRKPGLYAEAGIPHYLRVTTDPATIFAYDLTGDGTYKEVARAATGDTLRLESPFPFTFDPAALDEFW